MKSFLFKPNKRCLALICVGVVLNLMGRALTTHYSAPFFLDTIGTFLVAILIGPVGGAITGLLLNIGNTILFSGHWQYAIVSIGGALLVGHFLHDQERIDSFKVVGTSVLTGFVTAILSTPIDMIVLKGWTNNVWGDALVELLSQYISVRTICCLAGEILINLPDKAITIILLMMLIIMARKAGITLDLDEEEPVNPKHTVARMLLILFVGTTTIGMLPQNTMEVQAIVVPDFVADFASTTYGAEDGLYSTVMNAVTQTGDGFIWLGSYAGLYRYDGVNFEAMNLDERITNSMVLYTDRKGRLWIGTNDSGIACYDPYTEELAFFTSADGLPSNYIRSICEDSVGNIYVGTSSYMARITLASQKELAAGGDDEHHIRASKIVTYKDLKEVVFVQSLAVGKQDEICGVTQNGVLFMIQDGKLMRTATCPWEGNAYTAVCYVDEDHYLVGSTGEHLDLMRVSGTSFVQEATYETAGLRNFNCIRYRDSYGGYLVGCDNGYGFIDRQGNMQNLTSDGFDTGISDIHVDRQGSIWLSSSKEGLRKLAKNPFSDVFEKIGQAPSSVNAVCVQGSDLYIGMDSGVIKIDAETKEPVEDERLAILENVRVRQIMADSAGNLWFSTYGEEGLVKITPEGDVKTFSASNCDILGTRFRFTQELSDGRILVGSTDGLSYLKNDEVVKTIGADDGMTLPKVLSVQVESDGSLWVGTDGDGVYRIENDKVVDHITEEDGLKSQIVMKIVPCTGGRIYVCSNGLYYHPTGETVRKLQNFPYTNNYDVYITEYHQAFISSSAGLYVVSEAELLANEPDMSCSLLNAKCGLTASLTANAWDASVNHLLYLCCTEGVRILDMDVYDDFDAHYQIAICKMTKEGEEIHQVNGCYIIPAGSGDVVIAPAILNYTLSNPPVYVELEGVDKKGRIMRQSDMTELHYGQFPYGDYQLKIQVLNEAQDTVLKEKVYLIHKDAKLYEMGYFKTYILCNIALLLTFIVWLLSKLGNMAVIHRQYEEIRDAKEDAEYANQAKSHFLAQMSHEIRTPINAVLGMDEMILRESREPEIRGYAVDIYNAGQTLLSLINDILDSSKIESGKMEIVPVEYDLAVLVRDLINIISQRAHAKDLKLEVTVDPDLPRRLYGDDVRIRQILTNLLTNAVKYTMTGSVSLRINGVREGSRLRMHVEVEDTGIGIKEEDLPKLFEAYRRIDEQRNRRQEGTGLGMTITLHLLDLMGSKLDVDSIYGKGSKFSFDLIQDVIDPAPVGDFDKSSKRRDVLQISEDAFTAEDAKILLVDDNAMNRKVFRSLLHLTKVHVSEAASGAEAIAMVDWDHYDVIFMDHIMPEMDGVEAMHRIRAKEHCKDIPIYALTANVVSGAKEEYMAMGFDGFVAKPMTADSIEEALRSALPADMIHPMTEEERKALGYEADKEYHALPTDLPEVDGLDWSYAWVHLPEQDLLRQGVRAFYELIPVQADLLKQRYEELLPKVGNKSAVSLTSTDEENPLNQYRIQLTAMKDAAAKVGIVPLAGTAKLLERAAIDGNMKFIHAVNESFLNEWMSYKIKLRGVFGLGFEQK